MQIKKALTEQDFKDMEALEKKYYSEDFIADYTDAYAWYLTFPFTTMAIEDRGRIVGFMELFPVQDAVAEQIKAGSFNDKHLKMEHILNPYTNLEKTLTLFLSCVVVDESYRRTGALTLLLKAYAAYYQDLLTAGYQIEEILTDNVTKQGEVFSNRLSFQRQGDSDHGTVIYTQKFDQFLKVVEAL
jgi:GNAT superfamily N-acetyltransferase